MKFGLSDTVINRIHFAFSNVPEIEKVLIYGSRAMGTNRAGSDIDLTIIGEVPSDQFNRLTAEIDELNLLYKTDLSLHHHIENRDLLDHIERVGKIFYQRGDKKVKETERRITPARENGSERFRVFYGDRSMFDLLRISITRIKTNEQRLFIIPAADLPESDSIHFRSGINHASWVVIWDEDVSGKIKEIAE